MNKNKLTEIDSRVSFKGMLTRLEKLEGKTLDINPWWEYRHDRYKLPDGSIGEYYFVHTAGSVMVVPVTESGSLVFVRQYRYLNKRESLEFPGGGIGKAASADDAARMELLQETGNTASTLEEIGSFNPMNGVTDELCFVLKASGLQSGNAAPEQSEEFELVELHPDEIESKISSGELWDGMTLAALRLFESSTRTNK